MLVRSRLSQAALVRILSIVCCTALSVPLVSLVAKNSCSWSAISSVAKCWKEAVTKCDNITDASFKKKNLLVIFFLMVYAKIDSKMSYIISMQLIPILFCISPDNIPTL